MSFEELSLQDQLRKIKSWIGTLTSDVNNLKQSGGGGGGGSVAWSNITGKPTTLAGYGITGAITSNGNAVITNGGQSLGVAMQIGTNDNQLLQFRVNNSVVASLTSAGNFSPTAIVNGSSANNANVTPGPNGTVISRNSNDANPSLVVNQVHASSTGDIFRAQAAGTNRFIVKRNGVINITTVPTEYAGDAAAASGGLAVGDIYRTGSALKIRVA